MPVPSLTIARAPAIAVVTLPPAVPPKVMVVVPVAGIPVTAIVPLPPTTLASVANVITPLYVAAPPLFINAPPLDTPVPFKVSGLAVLSVKPPRSKAAPVALTVVADDVPSAVVDPSFKVPDVTVNVFEKVLFPDSVNTPELPVVIA